MLRCHGRSSFGSLQVLGRSLVNVLFFIVIAAAKALKKGTAPTLLRDLRLGNNRLNLNADAPCIVFFANLSDYRFGHVKLARARGRVQYLAINLEGTAAKKKKKIGRDKVML